MIDQADTSQKKRDHRQLEGDTEGEHELRGEREVFSDADRRAHANRLIPAEQERKPQLKDDAVTKPGAEQKKKRAEQDKTLRVALLMVVKTRSDEAPDLPQHDRQRQ